MTKDEFVQRFQLSHLSKSLNQERLLTETSKLRQSAVLIALIEQQDQLHVLLTKRAEHLKHHAGQISFPGGKVEPLDKSFIHTALREADEEIGLSASACEVLGQLHPYQTNSGFHITPVIAFVQSDQSFTIDKNEVAEIFQVPLQHFLDSKNHISITMQSKSSKHKVHFMPYESYNIWGATAAILKDLAQHIN